MLICGSAAILCPEQVRATSELYWISAFVTAAIDVVAVALLIRLVPRDRFRQLDRRRRRGSIQRLGDGTSRHGRPSRRRD